MQTLDWIIYQASQRGLLLIPVLTNYRCEYGSVTSLQCS